MLVVPGWAIAAGCEVTDCFNFLADGLLGLCYW